MGPSTQIRANAPVARSVFWVMIPLIAWEVFQGIRAAAAVPTGSWSHTWYDLVLIVLLPALSAFAFTRLFLVLTQSNRGTLNIYSVISSPYAKRGFIDCVDDMALVRFQASDSTIREVASVVGNSLSQNWTSASEFCVSNGVRIIEATVVKTDPPASDAVAGASQSQILIDF